MSSLAIGIWCSVGLLALIALRVPIAIAMLSSAILGIYLVQGSFAAWFQLAGAPINATTYGLTVIPLFILMGDLAVHAGLSRDLFALASRAVGRLRGGLAMASLLGCAGFSTLSGSSLATVATMGRVSLGEMQKRDYHNGLAAGTIAAGGTLGILIPPSVMLVVYALLTEQSVRVLFAAGIVPGLVLTAIFILTVALWARSAKHHAPLAQAAETEAEEEHVPKAGVLSLVGLVVLVIGGLYAGFFTPTESAAIGAVGTLLIAWLRGGLSWGTLGRAVTSSASTSAMIFLIIIGSSLYATFLVVTGISSSLQGFVTGLEVAPIWVLLVILLIYLVLGCFMDSMGMLLLTIPIFYPVIISLGIDPVLFGVLVVMAVEVGLITPPMGMNVFVVRSIAPGVPLQTIFAGALPFVIAFFVAIALVMTFPGLALWLPGLMFGG